MYKVQKIVIESNFGDGAFHELLKPHLKRIYKYGKNSGCEVIDERAKTRKEKRIIETLEPMMMQHKLVVSKRALIKDQEKKVDYSFTHQLTHITEDAGSLVHDDIIDAVELTVSYWKKSLARDSDNALEEHRVNKIKADLKELEEKRRKNNRQEKRITPLHSF